LDEVLTDFIYRSLYVLKILDIKKPHMM